MSPLRRGEDGYEYGSTWEAIAEKKIREAMEAGAFDNLRGMGRPLHLDQNPYAGDWELGFHIMQNARIVPHWIELSREIETQLEACTRCLDRAAQLAETARPSLRAPLRAELAQRVSDLNESIETFNLVVPFAWLQKTPLSLEEQLRKFDERWPDG